jgi:arsenate reductase
VHRDHHVVKISLMYIAIKNLIDQLAINDISSDRQIALDAVKAHLHQKKDQKENIGLTFICTHNARRSHLAQIWAATMANYYGWDTVSTYSGGVEVTKMHPAVGETLQRQGFKIHKLSFTENPVYAVRFDELASPEICFSKLYQDKFNPAEGFTAILVCSAVEEACPFVTGCERRFLLSYEDPKISDGTPMQEEVYGQRSLEIAREMKHLFS